MNDTIDMQITTLQSTIYSMNQQLIQKRDELERLKTTHLQLEDYQEEFQVNQRYCLDPKISGRTWNGQQANQFDGFRNDEIKATYKSIPDQQLDHIIFLLMDKIEEIRASIGDMESDYASKNRLLSDLRSRRKGS